MEIAAADRQRFHQTRHIEIYDGISESIDVFHNPLRTFRQVLVVAGLRARREIPLDVNQRTNCEPSLFERLIL